MNIAEKNIKINACPKLKFTRKKALKKERLIRKELVIEEGAKSGLNQWS